FGKIQKGIREFVDCRNAFFITYQQLQSQCSQRTLKAGAVLWYERVSLFIDHRQQYHYGKWKQTQAPGIPATVDIRGQQQEYSSPCHQCWRCITQGHSLIESKNQTPAPSAKCRTCYGGNKQNQRQSPHKIMLLLFRLFRVFPQPGDAAEQNSKRHEGHESASQHGPA